MKAWTAPGSTNSSPKVLRLAVTVTTVTTAAAAVSLPSEERASTRLTSPPRRESQRDDEQNQRIAANLAGENPHPARRRAQAWDFSTG